jgi:hypothetical protein
MPIILKTLRGMMARRGIAKKYLTGARKKVVGDDGFEPPALSV